MSADPATDLLSTRFEQTARRHPARPALVAGTRTISFADLDATCARLAASLRVRGIGPGSLVGLHYTRQPELVVALLGILRAGAAYGPLDPAHPAERLAFMIEDCDPRLVLTDADPGSVPAPAGTAVSRIADLEPAPATATAADLAMATATATAASADPGTPHPLDLAYVIYTSGSTGRPKGVGITRAAVGRLLDLLDAGVFASGPARAGWNASPSFDASVQQWLHLLRGDTVVLLDEATRADPEALARLVIA